jgi:HlyD family secretion protein
MKKTTLIGVAVVVAVVLGVWAFIRQRAPETPSWRMVAIARGDIQSKVSASGTLGAVSTVQVGTQVSGQVAEIRADFNDRVKKGQVIARIDPVLAQQAVREAQAAVNRARADVELQQFNSTQAESLFAKGFLTETETRAARHNLATAKASLETAMASFERAQRNLDYTVIHAPIDGIVVERNVDVGQTVAASLAAPQLFLIAEDLSHMQIVVAIDESDIGQIREGQEVRFTVQAYPNRIFDGTVRQVRLQSKTTESVVSYLVVVEVPNRDGALLPGMTATVDVMLASAVNVLKVANAALRYRPDAAEVASAARAPDSARGMVPGDTQRAIALGAPVRDSAQRGTVQAGGTGQLWYLDASGRLTRAAVRTGLTDGQYTEVDGPAIAEGMMVIAGIAQRGAQSTTTNPFQQTRTGPGGPGGGGPPPGGGPP